MTKGVIQRLATIATAKFQTEALTFGFQNGNNTNLNTIHYEVDPTGVDGE